MKFRFPKDVEGWISLEEGKLLFELAQINPDLGCIVELGTYKGRSAICLAQGSKKVGGDEVFTVDTFVGGRSMGSQPDFYKQFKENVKRYNLSDHITAIWGDTAEAAKGWKKPLRLLFIDSSHLYDDVKRDFQAWERHLVSGGIVAFHDSLIRPGVNKLVSELIKSGDFKDIKNFSKMSAGITYAVKKGSGEPISRLEIYQTWLEFKLIGLRGLPDRFKQSINERGESDIWFKIFGTMANYWKKISRGRLKQYEKQQA